MHLHLILPIVVSPLFLELELRAVGRCERVDEVNLNLVDIDDVGDVTARRVKRQVPINRPVVGRAHLHAAFDHLRRTCAQSERHRLLDHLEIALREQLAVDVLNRLLRPVNQHDLQQDVVVVHLGYGFRVDWVRVARKLVDLLLVFVLELAHEVVSLYATRAKLFSDIEVAARRCVFVFELAELDALVRLSDRHRLAVLLAALARSVRRQQLRVRLQELAEDGASELDQHVLNLRQAPLRLRLGQNTQADLHALCVVAVHAHRHSLPLLKLVLLEKGADDENGVEGHLLVRHAQVALGFDRQLRHGHRQTTRQVVILCVDEGVAQGQVGTLVLGLGCGGRARSFVFHHNRLCAIATVWEHHCLRDNLGARLFHFFFLVFLAGGGVLRLRVNG
mmetsp:Transcript_19580/g.26463  ORF Transcript_19580/g.26463 Transcript_19580/m.26463 type:complete len:392 (-) Transcript_19580:1518-2693(-)